MPAEKTTGDGAAGRVVKRALLPGVVILGLGLAMGIIGTLAHIKPYPIWFHLMSDLSFWVPASWMCRRWGYRVVDIDPDTRGGDV